MAYSETTFGYEIAEAYLEGIDDCFELLREHPDAGSPRPDIDDLTRSFLYKRHLIFYERLKEAVRIIRVLHHAQDYRDQLKS